MHDSSAQNRDLMSDYLMILLAEAVDFSWSAAKANHAALLCHMEQGEISGWHEIEKVDRVIRAYAQRHVQFLAQNSKQDKTQANSKATPCVYFNKNTCLKKHTHETKGVLYKHVCSACWTNEGKSYPHSQRDCRKNKTKTKEKKERVGLDVSSVGQKHVQKTRIFQNSKCNYSSVHTL